MKAAPTAVLDDVAQVIAAKVRDDRTVAGQFAVSPTGGLAWLAGKVVPFPSWLLVTVDRRGNVSPVPAPARSYRPVVRLSPDGRFLAVTIAGLDDVSAWTVDVARGTPTLVARGGEADGPVWTPDGQGLLFSWLDRGRYALAFQRVDGTTRREVLATEGGGEAPAGPPLNPAAEGASRLPMRLPGSWMPDGRRLLLVGHGIEIASIEGGRAAVEQVHVGAQGFVRCPEFSPNGRWLVYVSDESGRPEVYVESYPGPARRVPISIRGGHSCAWSKNGREIFYVGLRNAVGVASMMAADFDPESGRVGAPKALFEIAPALYFGFFDLHPYDISRDGQRFYVRQERAGAPPPPVTHIDVITNWFEELKAKVPPAR